MKVEGYLFKQLSEQGFFKNYLSNRVDVVS